MTIVFTEEEEKYLIKEPFNWHMAEDTPPEIEKTLKHKLELLYRKNNNNEL